MSRGKTTFLLMVAGKYLNLPLTSTLTFLMNVFYLLGSFHCIFFFSYVLTYSLPFHDRAIDRIPDPLLWPRHHRLEPTEIP